MDFNHTWDGYVTDVVDLSKDDRIKSLEKRQEESLGSVDLEINSGSRREDCLFISDVLNKPIEDITESEWDFWG